jgi:hypothetical protein
VRFATFREGGGSDIVVFDGGLSAAFGGRRFPSARRAEVKASPTAPFVD